MGEYWVTFMEIDACHVGNVNRYLSSSRNMLPGIPVYNNHDYGKWLPGRRAMITFFPYEKKNSFSCFSRIQDSLCLIFLRYGAYLKTWIAGTVMGRHVVGQTTYGLITLMCSLVYSRHNNATTIILINDNYTVLTSIKDDKHEP